MLTLSVLALVVPLITAQGTIVDVVGDLGGNTTSLAYNAGSMLVATVFPSKEAKSDGMGMTLDGKPVVRDFKKILAEYGSTLPQVSDGGPVTGTWRADNAAGGGPLRAVLDTTCTGHFSNGTELEVVKNIPGSMGTVKAAAVGQQPQAGTYEFSFIVKRSVRCAGNDEGIAPNCMIKVTNDNGYGAIFAIQQRLTGKNGELPPAVKPSYPYDGPAPYDPNPNAHLNDGKTSAASCKA